MAPLGSWFSAKYSHILLSLLIAHSVNLGTSTHLLSIVFVFMTTITRCKLSFSKDAARHGPAAGVTPVFTPLKPFPRSLFVLVHQNSLVSSWRSRPVHEQCFWMTISRTRGSCITMHASFPMSAAVDLLFLCERPCGFAQFVDSRPSARAYLFIS